MVAETATGHQVKVLKTWKGRTPAAVRTTIEGGVQSAAARTVASAPGSAAIVAMQASTGHILAVAGHSAGGMPAIDALAGHYPPGGAFTIVSTEALLASGLQVNTVIPCVPVNPVGGRNFRNVPAEPNLGEKPTFAVDFAHSCGTAFAGLTLRSGMRDYLATAVKGFGLGVEWRLPLKSFSGQVEDPAGVAAARGRHHGPGQASR